MPTASITSNAAAKKQERALATAAALELVPMLPARYMDFVYAISSKSDASVEVCHKVIANLENEGLLYWNQYRSRLQLLPAR